MRTYVFYFVLAKLVAAGSANAQVIESATAAWTNYESKVSALGGKVVFKLTDVNNPTKLRDHTSTTFAQKHGKLLCQMDFLLDQKQSSTVECFNDRYYFLIELLRSSTRPTLKRLAKRNSEFLDQELNTLFKEIKAFTLPLTVFTLYLPDVIKEPCFHVDRFENAAIHDRTLVKMSFRYQPPSGSKCTVRHGTVYLDPEHYWVVRQWDAMMSYSDGSSSRDVLVNNIRVDENKIPLLTNSTQTVQYKETNGQQGTFHRIRELALEVREANDKNLMLSNHGFAEPFVESTGARPYTLLLACICAFVFVCYQISCRFRNNCNQAATSR